MAVAEVINVPRIVGRIMLVGSMLPALALKPTTVVGKNWIEVALTISSIIIGAVILPLPSSRRFMAFMPIGVEALPSPSILLDIFRAIYFSVSGSLILKSQRMNLQV